MEIRLENGNNQQKSKKAKQITNEETDQLLSKDYISSFELFKSYDTSNPATSMSESTIYKMNQIILEHMLVQGPGIAVQVLASTKLENSFDNSCTLRYFINPSPAFSIDVWDKIFILGAHGVEVGHVSISLGGIDVKTWKPTDDSFYSDLEHTNELSVFGQGMSWTPLPYVFYSFHIDVTFYNKVSIKKTPLVIVGRRAVKQLRDRLMKEKY